MKKDSELKKIFEEYIDGSLPPEISAEDAKKAFRDEKKRRKRTAVAVRLLSAAACFVVAFAVVLRLILPRTQKLSYYSTETLTESKTFYDDLSMHYPEVANAFREIEYSPAAHADYFVLSDEGEARLVRIEITMLERYGREDAVIYAEPAALRETAEDLREYYELSQKNTLSRNEYKYEKSQVDGEWNALGYLKTSALRVFISVQSPNAYSLEKYLRLFL